MNLTHDDIVGLMIFACIALPCAAFLGCHMLDKYWRLQADLALLKLTAALATAPEEKRTAAKAIEAFRQKLVNL